MADDFFKKEEEKVEDKPQEITEPEKVKVGEKEYTQEELSRLVGLGELGAELETKWNTRLDRLYPEYTEATKERAELRKFKEEQEAKLTEEKAKKGEELTPEELKKQALSQAEEIGLVHSGNINNFIAQFLSARDLLDDAETVLESAKGEGKPQTSVEDLLAYMDQTGIKSPEKAYKDKYEKELDTWKEEQLAKVKANGMQTIDTSTAGGKQPETPPITNIDSLRDAMKGRFTRN